MNSKKIGRVLKRASAKDTCWPLSADSWSPKNPAWGHCVMYALYINEFFGGKLVFMEAVDNVGPIAHCFNRINGKDIDLSRSQFEKGTRFSKRKIITRDYLLSRPDREAERYQIFRQRVLNLL